MPGSWASRFDSLLDNGIRSVIYTYDVLLDATVIESHSMITAQPFTLQRLQFFTTPGMHTLTFRGTTRLAVNGDNTAFGDHLAAAVGIEQRRDVTFPRYG